MGVVSNKINIMELMKSGGGGDPTLPGRVSTLETETAGLIEANAKIMTSVAALNLETAALAEANAKIMTSVSALDLETAGLNNQINAPTTGLNYRVETLENAPNIKQIINITVDTANENGKTFLKRCHNAIENLFNSLNTGEKLKINTFNWKYDYICCCLDNIFTKGTDTLSSSIPLHFIGSHYNLTSSDNLTLSIICMRGNDTSFGKRLSLTTSGITVEQNMSSTTLSTGMDPAIIECVIYK